MKSIIFDTEDVQGLINGEKTVTRRVIKRRAVNDDPSGYGFWKEFQAQEQKWYIKDYSHSCTWWGESEYLKRYGKYQVGDVLYVKETWMMQSMKSLDHQAKILFKAEPNQELLEISLSSDRYDDLIKYESRNGWQPSTHMPKEAARLFLRITDVRIEQLQDITFDGCKQEGIWHDGNSPDWTLPVGYRRCFFELWNSRIKKKDLQISGWQANPWVWVVEFNLINRCEAQENKKK